MANVDLSGIPGNSHSDKKNNQVQTKERPSPVVSQDKLAKTKKSLGKKMLGLFIQEDVKDIKKWLVEDVLVPGVKHLVLDSISMAFFHEFYNGRGGNPFTRNGTVSYDSYYKSNGNRNGGLNQFQRLSNRYYNDDRNRIDYRDIVLIERQDAEDLVRHMYDLLDEYHKVSIGDLYSLVDITPNPPDFNWGWTDYRDIGIRTVSNGFLISLTEARPID